MAISIWITDQDTGDAIEKTDIFWVVGRAYCSKSKEGLLDSVRLLKYIDEYGGTSFNNLQFDDLRNDCEIIKQYEIRRSQSGVLSAVEQSNSKKITVAIDKLISLIDRRKNDIHIYIRFLGD